MNSHELARLLLTLPDLPVATHAMNNTYMSKTDAYSHGPLKIGRLHTYDVDHVVIGDISKRNINGENWRVTEMWHGEAPEEWWRPGHSRECERLREAHFTGVCYCGKGSV